MRTILLVRTGPNPVTQALRGALPGVEEITPPAPDAGDNAWDVFTGRLLGADILISD